MPERGYNKFFFSKSLNTISPHVINNFCFFFCAKRISNRSATLDKSLQSLKLYRLAKACQSKVPTTTISSKGNSLSGLRVHQSSRSSQTFQPSRNYLFSGLAPKLKAFSRMTLTQLSNLFREQWQQTNTKQ